MPLQYCTPTQVLLDECQTHSHMLPPGKTDEVQPVDDGMGRQVKIYMGQFQDTWLENDDNLEKWESNQLTASDRRVLIATWFYDAVVKACESPKTKRKYFEHTGALMTADGTDDDKMRFEAKPKGEVFTFMDEGEAVAGDEELPDYAQPDEPEPEDVAPEREDGHAGNVQLELDDQDQPDDDDGPAAPREPPPGFAFAASPPTAAALAFSKQASLAADALVGQRILFHWPVIGWYMGTIQRRVFDGRIKRDGEQCNFYIHYEVDDEEAATALLLDDYDGVDEHSWLLLEPAAEASGA